MAEVNQIPAQLPTHRIDIPRFASLFMIVLLLVGATWIRAYKVTTIPAGYAFDATWSWLPGELVTTSYTLNIPTGDQPNSLYVGMYSYPSLVRLAVTQNGNPIADNRVNVNLPLPN